MAWPVLIIGLLLIISGFRGKTDEFVQTVKEDFTGQPNFLVWVAAVFAIGSLGAIKPLKPVSDGLFVLVLVVLILSNRGFFAELSRQINAPSSGNKSVEPIKLFSKG